MRDDEKLAKIRDIPLELIDDFPDHPYKVRDDEDMMQLVESILPQLIVGTILSEQVRIVSTSKEIYKTD